MVNFLKSQRFYVLVSLLCAVSMFVMSNVFQSMAYWGEGLTWYWVGVSFTYLIWLIGIVLLVLARTRKTTAKGKLIVGLPIMGIATFILLICGCLWTTFVIIAGLSGI